MTREREADTKGAMESLVKTWKALGAPGIADQLAKNQVFWHEGNYWRSVGLRRHKLIYVAPLIVPV